MYCLACGTRWKTSVRTCKECRSSKTIEESKLCFQSYICYYLLILIALFGAWYVLQIISLATCILCLVGFYHVEAYRKQQFIDDLKSLIPDAKNLVLPKNTPSFVKKAFAPQTKNTTNKRTNNIRSPQKERIWRTAHGTRLDAICPICEHNLISCFSFHCGHIISLAENGSDEDSNIVPICAPCNLSMGTENMYFFKARIWGHQPHTDQNKKRNKNM